LVEIDQVVYDEKIFKLFICLFSLNLHNRSKSAKHDDDGLKFVLYEHNYVLFSSPGHGPYELLPSGFVRRPLSVRHRLSLAFHILIFSSENTEPQVVYDEKIFKLFICLFSLNLHNRSKSAKVKSSYENPEYNMLKSS
jgi:hypothetical protein